MIIYLTAILIQIATLQNELHDFFYIPLNLVAYSFGIRIILVYVSLIVDITYRSLLDLCEWYAAS